MKESEAVRHLRAMMAALQKFRSNAVESCPDEGILEDLFPWIFGEKCPLNALAKLIDRIDSGAELLAMDYYNQITILYKFMPEVLLAAMAMGIDLPSECPAPLEVLQGWKDG